MVTPGQGRRDTEEMSEMKSLRSSQSGGGDSCVHKWYEWGEREPAVGWHCTQSKGRSHSGWEPCGAGLSSPQPGSSFMVPSISTAQHHSAFHPGYTNFPACFAPLD